MKSVTIDLKPIITAIIIPLAVGGLSAGLSGDTEAVYSELNKPPFSPPSGLFPIVWAILYILMGVSSYLIWDNYRKTDNGRVAITIYAIQLVVNFFWSIIFFGCGQPFIALIVLLILIALVVAMIISFGNISPTAAALQIPYLIWCIFAGYLNYSFWVLN